MRMELTWIGHSCFKLTCAHYVVIFDPYTDGSVPGYTKVSEWADLVLCSHMHKDHNAASQVTLRINGKRKNPFYITKIETFHDDQQGQLRGRNVIHLLETGTWRMAHLGDLGCALTGEQIKMLSGLDLLLIPVGGTYTIDAVQAKAIVDKLKPRITIPMHYRGRNFGYDVLDRVEAFTRLCADVSVCHETTIEITDTMPEQVIVMQPQNVAL